MNAQNFLELTGRMLEAQREYRAALYNVDTRSTVNLLVSARCLEEQVMAVIREGHLEPDAPTAHVYTPQEYEDQLALMAHRTDDIERPYGVAIEEDAQ